MQAVQLRAGATHALENARRLLTDATDLLRTGKSPSSLVLTTLALEELGRRALLLAMAEEIDSGTITLSESDVSRRLDDHVVKLRKSQTIVAITMTSSQQKRLEALATSYDPATHTALMEELHQAAKVVARRKPDDRHHRRLAAMYVDPLPDGSWRTPAQISSSEAKKLLSMALSEYANVLLNFEAGH